MSIEEVMSSVPHGENHGRKALELDESDIQDHSAPTRPMKSLSHSDHEAVAEGQVHEFDLEYAHSHGMVAHRGVLHPDEYVDIRLLWLLVEMHLGYTLDEVTDAYAPGRPDESRLKIRNELDSKFLQLQEAGGNMTMLSKCLGWPIQDRGECRRMSRALRRAREARK